MTFLDDTCSVDCPLIAQEFREAGQLLAADARRVELVEVNYNPLYTQVSYIQAFDRQEGLDGVPNWLYLTGTRARLQQIWHDYGLPMEILPAGSMLGHGDYAFVIDQVGHLRQELDFNPGPATASAEPSLAAELTDPARQLLGPPWGRGPGGAVPAPRRRGRQPATAGRPGQRPGHSTGPSPTSPTPWPPRPATGTCSRCSPMARPRRPHPAATPDGPPSPACGR